MGKSWQQLIESIDPAEAPGEAVPGERGGSEIRDRGHMPWREEGKATDPVSTVRGTAEGAAIGGGIRQDAGSSNRAAARRGVQDEDKGRRHAVVLTP
jgi:hypothetical protein